MSEGRTGAGGGLFEEIGIIGGWDGWLSGERGKEKSSRFLWDILRWLISRIRGKTLGWMTESRRSFLEACLKGSGLAIPSSPSPQILFFDESLNSLSFPNHEEFNLFACHKTNPEKESSNQLPPLETNSPSYRHSPIFPSRYEPFQISRQNIHHLHYSPSLINAITSQGIMVTTTIMSRLWCTRAVG